MSETPFPRRSVSALAGRGQLWLLTGLIWSLTPPALAAEARKDNAARLGFRFDQQAHDAAVAKEKAASDAVFAADPSDHDVVRLPRYTVTEDRIALEERDVLTRKGELDLAKKRYLKPLYQKTLGPLMAIPGFLHNPLGGLRPNAPEAMAIYEDFETLRRKNRMAELTDLAELADDVKKPKAKTPDRKREKRKSR